MRTPAVADRVIYNCCQELSISIQGYRVEVAANSCSAYAICSYILPILYSFLYSHENTALHLRLALSIRSHPNLIIPYPEVRPNRHVLSLSTSCAITNTPPRLHPHLPIHTLV